MKWHELGKKFAGAGPRRDKKLLEAEMKALGMDIKDIPMEDKKPKKKKRK